MLRTGLNPARGGWGTAGNPTSKVVGLPAPVGGINAVDPLAGVQPQHCLSAVNFVCEGRTLKVRPGHRQFATSVGNGNGIRTIIPFEAGTTANNKLFAVAREGIYDITAGGAIGAAEVGLSNGTNTGWGTWTNFVSDAGTHYAFYADETDGLFRRAEAGTWAAVLDITGVAETALVHVMQFKGRLWFIERNTAKGWYLASGAISGAATSFNFGNKFKHGGTLVGLYSWTVDGGEGIDDHLVAISSSGDVMVYKGTDPSSVATWELVGQYYVGAVPAGFRVAAPQGGDLYILSQYGVIPLTRLMQGTLVQQEEAQLSRNIAPLIAQTMVQTRTTRGWELKNVPSINAFIVATPPITGEPEEQFCMSTFTQGWTVWNDLPYVNGEVYLGNFYFGDSTDGVWQLTGETDGADSSGNGGLDISWTLLTSFQEYGEIGLYHQIQILRPVFLTATDPGVSIEARYDYEQSDAAAASAAADTVGAMWDSAVWDDAIWGASVVVATRVRGATGVGRAFAVAMAGKSNAETGLVRIDVMFTTGGPL